MSHPLQKKLANLNVSDQILDGVNKSHVEEEEDLFYLRASDLRLNGDYLKYYLMWSTFTLFGKEPFSAFFLPV